MDISTFSLFLFPALIVAAILYSSVGHGGASGYMAVMVLFGLAPGVMRPAALCMNIAVTSWVLFRHKKSLGDLRKFSSLILVAIPAAFIGGAWQLDSQVYKILVAAVLLLSALRMFLPDTSNNLKRKINPALLVAAGISLGLLAGMTGVGGGIFLSPLLVVLGWCSVKHSIVPVAAFIGLNSIAGLAGFASSGGTIPNITPMFVALAFVGGLLGTEVSLRHKPLLSRLLGVVLCIAAVKMLVLGLA